ncbi:MAG: hypothetical protein [Cressdnaviricota sp.]|nr:MAG: hypothetical protein [Cressdnaviricota sp.]
MFAFFRTNMFKLLCKRNPEQTIAHSASVCNHKKHPQSFGQQCRQILRLILSKSLDESSLRSSRTTSCVLIFTFTFMLLVTRMLSVKRGGVIILAPRLASCPPFLSFALLTKS